MCEKLGQGCHLKEFIEIIESEDTPPEKVKRAEEEEEEEDCLRNASTIAKSQVSAKRRISLIAPNNQGKGNGMCNVIVFLLS